MKIGLYFVTNVFNVIIKTIVHLCNTIKLKLRVFLLHLTAVVDQVNVAVHALLAILYVFVFCFNLEVPILKTLIKYPFLPFTFAITNVCIKF